MRRFAQPGVAAALLACTAFFAAAAADDCIECHEDVDAIEGVHGDLACADCHPDFEQTPHRRAGLERTPGEAVCLQCHESTAALTNSVHSELSCADCHDEGHEIELSSEEVCADCHRKAARLLDRSVHAGNAKCVDCHEYAHSMTASNDPDSLVSPVKQIHTCGSCHNEPPELIDDYLTSAHAKALLVEGFEDAPGCAHCHGAHDTVALDEAKAATSRENSPEMCGSCHVATLSVWKDISAHGKAWASGNEQAPVCSDCHASHVFTSPRGTRTRLEFVESCGNCHAEYYTSYRVTFHGEATDLRMATAATCADCHQWHRNLPADHPESSVHADNLAETCGACHKRTTPSFLSFDPHNDPTDRESNPQVYFVWVFMTGLLLAVFGFFFLHDALWLQRSLVGVVRGEFERVIHDGPYVRRFSRTTIGLHLVVIVTFLLLAATGLPLKFHWMSWAQPLVNALGGIESARALHRFAAIATFGYAIFHLANVVTRWRRGERGLFWGVDSLIPQQQDVLDVLRNLRYFLYLGPRPSGDKWTYWEKFDYMAVFWGIPIIGISGLFLWYPNFFGQLFPGWVLNAAHVIHSEEALLATGFIFVFHFFHTHLRPESFPMDPVIFTGSMPLQRFREERPREYRRLEESGELDSLLVDPPTKLRMRMAHVFGFIAIIIGVALAAGIFWSILSTWPSPA